jgi:hypothetical protein
MENMDEMCITTLNLERCSEVCMAAAVSAAGGGGGGMRRRRSLWV